MTRLLDPRGQSTPRDIATAVNQALTGKLNSVDTVTLTANAASTTVNNPLVSKSSSILFSPQSAHAAAEIGNGTMYVDPANTVEGTSFQITHANNSQTDRTFGFCILG